MAKSTFKLTKRTVAILIIAVIVFVVRSYLNKTETTPEGSDVEIHFIDVGQGDATLILSENHAVLIDTGTREHADTLISYVSGYTKTIDLFILTHPDSDHIGGAADVIAAFEVKTVLMTDAVSNTYTFNRLLDAIEKYDVPTVESEVGTKFEYDGYTLTVLAPTTHEKPESQNSYSIVCRMVYGDFSALFVGDGETDEEKTLIEKYGDGLKSDILKVGHHGSKSSSSVAFLKAVSPKTAVICVGKDNDYGHPHKQTLTRLSDIGAEILRTDELGSIVFTTDGTGYSRK